MDIFLYQPCSSSWNAFAFLQCLQHYRVTSVFNLLDCTSWVFFILLVGQALHSLSHITLFHCESVILATGQQIRRSDLAQQHQYLSVSSRTIPAAILKTHVDILMVTSYWQVIDIINCYTYVFLLLCHCQVTDPQIMVKNTATVT